MSLHVRPYNLMRVWRILQFRGPFSAYGFGWGYCAFALPAEAVCEKLGAANETPKQLMLAFELGKRRVLQAVEQKALPSTGERITLSADDL
ncbi:hypothetical protein P0D88_50855 [Paraburkholderia sp. RL18-103-BIB-C]|uniref:hypothetical protein n=1 Tax=unclassified Paraburkholderia TaxID=2615204 RepID=UPI0038BD8607